MKYYLKVGENTRLLQVGDFFIGADGLNHTYNEAVSMSTPDRLAIGVHELDDISVDFEVVYNPTNMLLRQLEEAKALRMVNQFAFRKDNYSATVRDLATVNILLAIANDRQLGGVKDIGNLLWFHPTTPFFWHTADGKICNMDIPTFKDFAKSMVEYVMACNICATLLKHNILKGESVDIMANENWPKQFADNYADEYAIFTNRLIDAKYGDGSSVDDAYQSQIDLLAGLIE